MPRKSVLVHVSIPADIPMDRFIRDLSAIPAVEVVDIWAYLPDGESNG